MKKLNKSFACVSLDTMFSRFFTKPLEKTILGRWNRTCETVNSIKVYWANMDHCGTCSKEGVKEKMSLPSNLLHGKHKTLASVPPLKRLV